MKSIISQLIDRRCTSLSHCSHSFILCFTTRKSYKLSTKTVMTEDEDRSRYERIWIQWLLKWNFIDNQLTAVVESPDCNQKEYLTCCFVTYKKILFISLNITIFIKLHYEFYSTHNLQCVIEHILIQYHRSHSKVTI